MYGSLVAAAFLSLAFASPPASGDGLSTQEQQKLMRSVKRLEAEVKDLRKQVETQKRRKPQSSSGIRIEYSGREGESTVAEDSGVDHGETLMKSVRGIGKITKEKLAEIQRYLLSLKKQREEMSKLMQEIEKEI